VLLENVDEMARWRGALSSQYLRVSVSMKYDFRIPGEAGLR
jgi:hypothetical protein